MTNIYLDYNATTPVRPDVIDAMSDVLSQPLNASAIHGFGREGRKLVEKARAQVAAMTGAPVNQVIFNSGATEGNNTVLKHFKNERVLISAIEHPSVLEALPDAVRIPITSEGVVNLDVLEALLREECTALVSVMFANNETGIVQPVLEIAKLAHANGALFHCDGVQAAGKLPLDISKIGADFLTICAHKFGGPQGVGALIFGLCGETPVLLEGGGQEKSARAGTENVAAIIGMGVAAEMAAANLEPEFERLQALQLSLETHLTTQFPELVIVGADQKRLPNTTLFIVPDISSERLLMALDLEGFAISNGSACSSGTIRASHVLLAMGYDEKQASSALRVSTGWATTQDDIDSFLQAWERVYARIKK